MLSLLVIISSALAVPVVNVEPFSYPPVTVNSVTDTASLAAGSQDIADCIDQTPAFMTGVFKDAGFSDMIVSLDPVATGTGYQKFWKVQNRDGTMQVGFQKVVNNVPVINQLAFALMKGCRLFGSRQNNVQPTSIKPPVAKITAEQAVANAEALFDSVLDASNPEIKQVYVQTSEGVLVYCHRFQLQKGTDHRSVSIDAETGKLVQTVDFTANFENRSPEHFAKNLRKRATSAGPRFTLLFSPLAEGVSNLENPAFNGSSPDGWNTVNGKVVTVTSGNNVDASMAIVDGSRSQQVQANSDQLDFRFDPQLVEAPFDASKVADTSRMFGTVTSLFIIINSIHDIAYQYGFDELSGNFQLSNFGKGGKENDAVDAVAVQDVQNNAQFSTPPDGQRGRMQTFLFELGDKLMDSAVVPEVVIHEFTHGISKRLTGGPSNAACLDTVEAGGLGEGWSDAVALIVMRKKSDTRATNVNFASALTTRREGIRKFPYSTNLQTNPRSFKDLQDPKLNEVHAIGEIWASMLFEMLNNLIDKHGFATNMLDSTQQAGNVIALKLVIQGMKLQPCNPTFKQAREAILKADELLFNGENKAEITSAFAKRGL